MGRLVATFDGGVVADPESFKAGNSTGIQFPVYVRDQSKNRDTGNYEDTGDVSKIRVTLWNDQAESADIRKGDIVEVVATLVEKEFEKKDGTVGRSLQTKFVDSVVVKYRKDDESSSSYGTAGGFSADAPIPAGF